MNIYSSSTTDFNNNGLGFLTDTIDAKVTEILNGEMSLSLVYPIGGHLSDHLVEENIIKTDIGEGNLQLFRIKNIAKSTSRINVYALHIFYDLLDNMLLDVAPTDLSCQSSLEWILARTEVANGFSAYSDITSTASARYIRLNPVEAIIANDNSLINKFGAEIERDNFTIKLLTRRGADNKVKLLFGKNIKEIGITTNSTGVMTKIMPLGADALMLPEVYVDSPLIGDYPSPKIAKVEFKDVKYDPTDPDAYQTLEDAYDELRRLTGLLYSELHVDTPAVSVKVDWIELSKVHEYYEKYSALETVHLGDTITAEILGLSYITRCIKTVFNVLLDRIETFEIGTFVPTLNNEMTVQLASLSAQVAEVDPVTILAEAQTNATNLITTAMGGYVLKTQNELFIMDSPDPETAQKVWRWNVAGLGYSETGVNGTYSIAMTNDGKIVADAITAGTMAIGKISGLQGILDGLQNSIDINKDNVQIAINGVNTINANGVSRLVNTLVTIDTAGINVSQTGSQVASLLANDGMTIYKDKGTANEVKLLIAGKLPDNSTGVQTDNIVVKNFLIIGQKSRMEDYGTGTGVFFIGS